MKGAENEASSSCRSFFSLPFHCCAQNLFVYFFILAEINTVCAADRLPRSFASSTAFLRVAKLANLKGVDESPHRRSSGDRSPRVSVPTRLATGIKEQMSRFVVDPLLIPACAWGCKKSVAIRGFRFHDLCEFGSWEVAVLPP